MRHKTLARSFLSILLVALPPVSAWAEKPIFFNPPMLGAPSSRIGGGTRGVSAESVKIQVLAPEQTAYTARTAPTLYWHSSGASSLNAAFSLSLENDSQPLLEKNLGAITASGTQAIRLNELGIELKPDQDYRWSVALGADALQPPSAFSSATIRYVKPAADFASAAEMAEAGYWYDALDRLVKDKSPKIGNLLEQVGLKLPGY